MIGAKIIKIIVFAKQRMVPHVSQRDAAIWVDLYHALNQILGFGADEFRHIKVALLGLLNHDIEIGIIERQVGGQHGIKDDSKAPNISLVSSVLLHT